MSTIKFSDQSGIYNFELDLNNKLFEINNDEYLKKYLKITKNEKKLKEEQLQEKGQ